VQKYKKKIICANIFGISRAGYEQFFDICKKNPQKFANVNYFL